MVAFVVWLVIGVLLASDAMLVNEGPGVREKSAERLEVKGPPLLREKHKYTRRFLLP